MLHALKNTAKFDKNEKVRKLNPNFNLLKLIEKCQIFVVNLFTEKMRKGYITNNSSFGLYPINQKDFREKMCIIGYFLISPVTRFFILFQEYFRFHELCCFML